MPEYNAVIAVYETHIGAQEALKSLSHAGVDMRSLSIIAKDSHSEEHVVSYYNTGDRMKYWGKTGAYWGGFWGLMIGSAVFAIPGVGPVLAAGPVIAWIVGALEGAVLIGGLSAIGAGLYGLGIPHDSVLQYETAIHANNFLLMVHGETKEVEKARDILGNTQLLSMKIYSTNAPMTSAS